MAPSRSQIEEVLCCPDGIVRDRLWMWGRPTGSHNPLRTRPNGLHGLWDSEFLSDDSGGRSLVHGDSECCHGSVHGQARPNSIAENTPFEPVKRVIWSINLRVHRSRAPEFSWTPSEEAEHSVVRGLLKQYPDFTGIVHDDTSDQKVP